MANNQSIMEMANDPLQTNPAPEPTQGDASMERRPVESGEPQNQPASAAPPAVPDVKNPAPVADGRGPQVANPASNQDPTVPSVSARPQSKSLFDKILSSVVPGKQFIDKDGNVQDVPMTRGTMSAHILAGAITSMLQGAMKGGAASTNAPRGPAGTVGPANMAALGAGGQAGEDVRQKMNNAPQEKYDEMQLRKYQTMKRNIDLASSMISLGNASRASQDQVDSSGQALLEGVDNFNPSLVPEENRGLTHEEALQKFPSISENNFIPMGHRDMLNPDGTPKLDPNTGIPYREPLFAVVPPNAEITLTDGLREMYGVDNPAIKKIPIGTPISLSHFLKLNTSRINLLGAQDALSDAADQVKEITGTAPDVKNKIMSDPLLRKNAAAIGKYLSGKSLIDGISEMQKDKTLDPGVVSRLANVLGLGDTKDGLTVLYRIGLKQKEAELKEKSDDMVARKKAESDAERATPEGQLKMRKNQLEVAQLEQNVAQLKAASHGIEVPVGYTPDPKMSEMQAPDLLADLMKKGVKIPPEMDFNALYAVAHNQDDINHVFPSNPRKGVPAVSHAKALSFIKTFINPLYNASDFRAAQTLNTELASTKVNTAGGTLLAAGKATQHLDMLMTAAAALNNHDLTILNRIANFYKVQTGQPEAVMFKAIAHVVNTEVAKAASGNAPIEAELKGFNEDLNRDLSPASVNGVAKSYIGLMAGAIGEIDARSRQYFGRGIQLSPSATATFAKYGFNKPQGHMAPTPPNPNLKPPVATSQYPNGISPTGKFFWDGSAWANIPDGVKWDAQNKKWTAGQ